MKILYLLLLLAMFTVPVTFAQTPSIDVYFDHTYDYTFTRNDPSREVGPIIIMDQNGKSIKAAFGLRLLILDGMYTLWDESVTSVTARGTAVEKGKIEAVLTPVYSENLKEVYLQIKGDFAAQEQVIVEGLKMRVYHIANDRKYTGIDVNGDRVSDIGNLRWITISSTEIRTDIHPPSSVKEAKAVFDGSKVTVTWKDPKDLDFDRVLITRILRRDGKEDSSTHEVYAKEQQFVDLKGIPLDSISYKLEARDIAGNLAPSALVTITLQVPEPKKEEAPASNVPPPEEQAVPPVSNMPPLIEAPKKTPAQIRHEVRKARQQKLKEQREKRKKLLEERRKARRK